MRRVAGFALSFSSVFLAVVAVLIQAPSLFYMGTALFVLIGACNLQAHLATRGLRFERLAPASVTAGERVTIEISVWSTYRIRRPLIRIIDKLPERLYAVNVSPSLPIAPATDFPVESMYQFTAPRRGRYEWSGVTVLGTDALGLVHKRYDYQTETTEIIILPRPIPVSIELPSSAGWGISEAASGQTRGAGIEPRGIREYSHGDSLRHVHWRSSARAGRLLVKEFEAGTHAAAAFILQQTRGTDVGGMVSSLDLICGHALYLAETYLQQGARVEFPGLDTFASHRTPHERRHEISRTLALVADDGEGNLGSQLLGSGLALPIGSVVFLMLSVADDSVLGAISTVGGKGLTVVPLLYDGGALVPQAQRAKFRSATDPIFVSSLRGVGTSPIVMPLEGAQIA